MSENAPQYPKFLIAYNEGYNEKKGEAAFYVVRTQYPTYLAKITRNIADFKEAENAFKLPWGNFFFKIEVLKFFNGDENFTPNSLIKFVKTTLINNSQKK